MKLSASERADLISLLLETLDRESEPGVEAAWRMETSRRLKEIESQSVTLLPWEEAKAELHRGIDS